MTNNIKNALGVVGILAILMFAFAATKFADSYAKQIEPGSFRSFSASGEGKAVAVPDIATFTFSITTQGGLDLAELQQTNTEKANKAIDFVKSQGVKSEDIKTESYNVSPRYQYCTPSYPRILSPMGSGVSGFGGAESTVITNDSVCPPAEIVGYEINQTVSVKVRDFEKISALLGGVVENGANTVSSLNFTIDDPAELQNQARAMAIEKARVQAEATAKAAGFRIGKIISIEEGYYSPFAIRSFDAAVAEEAGKVAPTIEPGSQEVIINVTVRYEIQ
ncbi:MAG: SIMPL domain-containing protein [Candidatus Colwellbacteria bacterium]|nr:SIMPL domain-containing protein [Candidatus Colwellbacteria bacterium]